MDKAKFRAMFLAEAAEHLQDMSATLVRLDKDPDNRLDIDALFRAAHSIKGMAATMDFQQTARLAHHLEDGLDLSRKRGNISAAEIDQLLAAVDLLEALLEDIRAGQPERDIAFFIAAAADGAGIEDGPGDEEDASTLLVQIRLADRVSLPAPRLLVLLRRLADCGTILLANPTEQQILADEVTNQLLVRLRTDLDADEIHRQLVGYSDIEQISFPAGGVDAPATGQRSRPGTASVRVSTDRLDELINLTGELITTRHLLQNAVRQHNWQELDDGVGQLARLVKNLHHQVLLVRMVSLRSLFVRLSRTVHDLSRSSGKTIEFQTTGADIELDRAIVEVLVDPLSHMLRNAVDHGIRQQGRISLKAWRERDQVLIQVSDDGVGIDPHSVRQTALQRGLISAVQAANLSDYDLYQLICQPGFSTVATVTDISGRGVGMDVVKTTVEGIGGLVLIDSTPGEGTSITLTLPLSLAIIRVLLIESDKTLMAIPITRVIQAVEVAPADIHSSARQLMIRYQDEYVPLLSLRKILKQPKEQHSGAIPLVISEVMGRRVGLVVDRLVGQQEIFVQRLPAPFDQLAGCQGGTLLGDGRVVFLLDLQSLLERHKKGTG